MPTKRTQVLVCAGTGCTIGNSGELITEFEKEIKALGLEKEVEVLRTVVWDYVELVQIFLSIQIISFIKLFRFLMLKKSLWNTSIKVVQFIV